MFPRAISTAHRTRSPVKINLKRWSRSGHQRWLCRNPGTCPVVHISKHRVDWIRLDNFLVPMHAKFGLLSQEKASSHSAVLPRFFSFSCMQYFCVSIPPAVRPTVIRQMDMGSLTCAHMWVRAVYTRKGGGSGTKKSAQELTRRDRKTVPQNPRQRIEPRVFGFEFRLSNYWATSPVCTLHSSYCVV